MFYDVEKNVYFLHQSSLLYLQTHESTYARVVEFQSPVYFANSEIFVKAVYRDTGIHPDRVRKERKRNGKDADVEYTVKVCTVLHNTPTK